MMSWICFGMVVLLAVLIAVPGASADNRTMDTAHHLTHTDTLAGQKDISKNGSIPKPEPVPTMNETTARQYPNVTWYGTAWRVINRLCSFPFARCESPLTLMVMYTVNVTNPGQPGPVIGYSLTGWALKNPVNIFGAGKPTLFGSGALAGMLT